MYTHSSHVINVSWRGFLWGHVFNRPSYMYTNGSLVIIGSWCGAMLKIQICCFSHLPVKMSVLLHYTYKWSIVLLEFCQFVFLHATTLKWYILNLLQDLKLWNTWERYLYSETCLNLIFFEPVFSVWKRQVFGFIQVKLTKIYYNWTLKFSL